MKYYVILSLLGLTTFNSCHNKKDTEVNLETRNINQAATDEQKSALNFLAVNMDPYEEYGYINKTGDMFSKVYFYFDITREVKQIVVKRETYFDISPPKQVLTSNELRSVEYIISPIASLSPENISIGQGELDNQKIPNEYYLNIETLYKKPVQRIVKWYATNKEMGKKELERTDNVETSSFTVGFNDYNKANLFASKFKALCSMK